MSENIAQTGRESRPRAGIAQDEQHNRLEAKLRRELGEIVLAALADERTEDILLNPDGSLWVKRMGHGFSGSERCRRSSGERSEPSRPGGERS